MKPFVLLVLVAVASCQESSPLLETRGVISDLKDTIEKILNKETAIQQKIQEMIVKVEQVISDTKSWWESLKAETSPKRSLEYYLEQLYEKLVAEINAIADAAFEEVLKVVNMVVDKVDAVLEGIFAESTIRETIYNFLHDLLCKYIEMVVAALRKALEFLNFLEDYDWSAFIDRVIASVEESLFKKLDEFAQKIKDKLHPSGSKPETYGFIDDTKDFIDKIVQGETWLQAKLKELESKIDALVEDIKNWRSELEEGTAPDKPLEYYAKVLQEKVMEEVTKAIDTIFDEVVSVLRTVIDKLDELFDKIFGANGIKEKVFGWIDSMLDQLIEATTKIVRKALEVLNEIEDIDFSGIIEEVVESVENQIKEKLDTIRQEIKEKLGH